MKLKDRNKNTSCTSKSIPKVFWTQRLTGLNIVDAKIVAIQNEAQMTKSWDSKDIIDTATNNPSNLFQESKHELNVLIWACVMKDHTSRADWGLKPPSFLPRNWNRMGALPGSIPKTNLWGHNMGSRCRSAFVTSQCDRKRSMTSPR